MRDAVVVTGGAGFIGCAMADKLREFGLPVVAVDNLHPQVHPQRTRPADLPAHVALLEADVTRPDTWSAVLDQWNPAVLVHLAAETGTGQSLTEATRHADVNVVGTTAMLDAFAARGLRPSHVLLTSSRAVYGEGAWKETDSGEIFYPPPRSHRMLAAAQWSPQGPSGGPAQPLPHDAASVHPAPTSVYGATKLAQEHILSAWCGAMQVPLSIFRLQNVYGAGQSPFNAYTGIITLFHRIARQGGQIEIYEDGDIGRDFIYVSDVADALIAGLRKVPDGVRVLDVGSGVATTIGEAARLIAAMHGAPEPRVCGKFRDGDVRWAVANAQPLHAGLGSRASVDFRSGAVKVGAWLVERGYA